MPTENTLFVLGNGFDLAHEMPTKYEHFFHFLEIIRVHIQDMPWYSSMYYCDNSNLYEKMIIEIKSKLNSEGDYNYINAIADTLHYNNGRLINPWHIYFKRQLEHKLPTVTWIDFEAEIESLVTKWTNLSCSSDYLSDLAEKMFQSDEIFPDELYDIRDEVLSRDFSLGFPVFQNKAISFLRDELIRYAYCFELYLRFYVLSPTNIIQKNSFISNLLAEDIADTSGRRRFVLSFNYTDTVETVYPEYGSRHYLDGICNIHGKIRSSDELQSHFLDDSYKLKTPIILGFHNNNLDEEHKVSPFLWFEKFFQRIVNGYGNNAYQWIKGLQSYPNRLSPLKAIFYGHSLDVTDADLIRKIFAVANRVEIYYHAEEALPALVTKLVRTLGKEQISSAYADCQLSFIPAYKET